MQFYPPPSAELAGIVARLDVTPDDAELSKIKDSGVRSSRRAQRDPGPSKPTGLVLLGPGYDRGSRGGFRDDTECGKARKTNVRLAVTFRGEKNNVVNR